MGDDLTLACALLYIAAGISGSTALLYRLLPVFGAAASVLNAIMEQKGRRRRYVPWQLAVVPACTLYMLVILSAIYLWPTALGAKVG